MRRRSCWSIRGEVSVVLRFRLLALRVAAVFSVAVAAGHMVQAMRGPNVGAKVPGVLVDASEATELPGLSGIAPVSATTTGDDPVCALRLDLAAAPEAMIDLTLRAPCSIGESVEIRHSGLAFSGSIPADGRLQVSVPAMTANALVAAYVGKSEIILGRVAVTEVERFFRLAVHMPAEIQFDLRADEDGQVFTASGQMTGTGLQRVLQLGQRRVEDGLISQVYSATLMDPGNPELTAEVRITPETCGRTVSAEVITSRAGRVTHDLREVAMPLCGTSGDILLLKNLLPDVTLATPE